MSLTAQSPYAGHKRHLSELDSPDRASNSPKRRTSRCVRRDRSTASFPDPLTTLRNLFPHMDEKIVASVLESCSNIDEAILQLSNLHVTQTNGHDRSRLADTSGTSIPAPPPTNAAVPGSRGEQGEEEGQQKEEGPSKTPAEWVEGLVQQMAGAKDMPDARQRAAQELRAFEQAVIRSSHKARQGEVAALQNRVAEVSKENALLKRAVAIQQSRLQEAGSMTKQQASEAQTAIHALQEKVHLLEMTNYSLSMHLKEATANGQLTSRSHPDVF